MKELHLIHTTESIQTLTEVEIQAIVDDLRERLTLWENRLQDLLEASGDVLEKRE